MPELPEVEIIKRGLAKKIIGLKITQVDILNSKSFQGDPAKIEGATVINLWRRGKILGISLQQSAVSSQQKTKKLKANSSELMTLLIHLKMSGQLILIDNRKLETRALPSRSALGNSEPSRFSGGHPTKDMLGPMPNKSTRVILHLSEASPLRSKNIVRATNGSRELTYVLPQAKGKVQQVSATIYSKRERSWSLYFNDQRKFGWIKLASSDQLSANSFLNKLGPEPLEKDFTRQTLKQNLQRRKNTPIKVALLDQQIVSGIGNIYACEACFNAKIHPATKVSRLTAKDYQLLHQGIIDALTLSIAKGGSSKQHYVNEAGQKGLFLDFAFVYDRAKKPCKICQTPIEKFKLGGRGTYFCPKCQNDSIKE